MKKTIYEGKNYEEALQNALDGEKVTEDFVPTSDTQLYAKYNKSVVSLVTNPLMYGVYASVKIPILIILSFLTNIKYNSSYNNS